MDVKKIILILVLISFTLSGQESLAEQRLNACADKIEHIRVHEIIKLLETDTTIIILDVRTDREFKEAHLSNAVWAPRGSLDFKATSWFKDKNVLYLVYCKSGRRSALATYDMTLMGFKAKNIMGGLNAMKGTDLKIISGPAPDFGKAAE